MNFGLVKFVSVLEENFRQPKESLPKKKHGFYPQLFLVPKTLIWL